MKIRLDRILVKFGLVPTRSQAENMVKLGRIRVNGQIVTKPGMLIDEAALVEMPNDEIYVSRAGMKLAAAAKNLGINFKDKTVLDVGSSTGGFTDFALKNGASKVLAVDVGTGQLHPSLMADSRVEVHEQTDIRNFASQPASKIDLILIDVSFISLSLILPSVAKLASADTLIVAMVKPQFEAGLSKLKHKGVIKNETMRQQILKDFESTAHRK
ncbi:MAG: TlyA family RNA methyltransferase, partial [Candidatus Saccharimonadales bacterium]